MYHYLLLDAQDTQWSLTLAILYPWLATGDAWDRIYAQNARTAGQGSATPRASTPVEYLSVTDFKIGATSFLFRVEWPTSQVFPADAIDVLFNLGLEAEYWAPILWGVPVNQQLLAVEFEVPFGAFYLHVDGIPPPIGFFRVRPSDVWDEEEEGYIRDVWDQDDTGDPPDIPPLLPPPPWGWFSASGNSYAPVSVAQSIPAEPGEHYLITVYCADNVSPPANPISYAWTISVPGSPVISGSTDSYELASAYGGAGSAYPFQEFRFITIPTNATGAEVEVSLSSTPGDPTYTWRMAELRISRLSVHQMNMPLAAQQSPPGSTDNAGHKDYAYIANGGTAFITGLPQPPALFAELPFQAGFNISYAWRMTIETERPGYRNNSTMKLDDRKYPTNGLYTAYTNASSINVTQLMGNEIIGGKCTLYCRVRDENTGEVLEKQHSFTIRGMNPPDALARAYIDDVVATKFTKYARYIIRHESWTKSGYAFNQFNPAGDLIGLPNKTDDLPGGKKQWGWGMAQIDEGPFTNGATRWVTTAEVWNWKTNSLSAARKMLEKLAVHDRFMGYFTNTFSNVPFPPPDHTFSGVTWPAEQFAVTVLYNGAGTNAVPLSKVWTGEYNTDGSKKEVSIRSPVVFNRHGNRKWTFYDNDNGYAARVAAEMKKNPQAIKE